MRSASRTVLSLWATSSEVLPWVSVSVARWIHCSLSLSMLEVASSKIKMCGLLR